MSNIYLPGNLVTARSRTWVVQSGSSNEWLRLRPIGGADDEITSLIPSLEREPVRLAQFALPDPERSGSFVSAGLLYDALRFQLRSGAGPFRSFGSIAVEPRSYQLVPLLMSMRQKVVRLLIADDVGIGKTIEAGLIVREMMDRGEISRFAVLCPPHLVDQWVSELRDHFNIDATALTSGTAARLEKSLPHGKTIVDAHPVLVVSLDYIKSEKHRDYFQTMNLECIIVDEAHTCVQIGARAKQMRFDLLKRLAANPDRHMILLTATPHSGNEDGFYNLLSLLKEDFVELKGRESARDPLRQELAKCFVQRRRQDIAEWRVSNSDRLTGFPQRMTAEITYQLSQEWDTFFTHVQDYCRRLVDEKGEDNRLIWYAVLALFRCISSSPEAAVQALQNRLESVNATDEMVATPDLQDLDETSDSDAEPALFLDNDTQLNALIEEARNLQRIGQDPKLELLIGHVRKLLKEGFSPVVFCRYIATAKYVQKALQEALKNVAVDCVTGELAPEDRKMRVEELGLQSKRVLVATDCLSEGINLQQDFTAVVHYDLAWNPTRHEQREGRVDRFGQKAKEIRCTMLYGENNPVDGFILQVILKKSEAIQKSLGITVPVPQESKSIQKALIRAALFKDRSKARFDEAVQGSLFSAQELDEIQTVWTNALASAKRNRTVFAQQAIHPEEVYPLWQKQQTVLGSHSDLAEFSRNACAILGCHLEALQGPGELYRFPREAIVNESIRNRFADEGIDNNAVIDFDTIHRSSPFINVLSEAAVEQALNDPGKIFARSGVCETDKVQTLTRVYLLRLRYQMRLSYRNQMRRCLLSEEIVPVVVSGVKQPKWDFSDKAGGYFSIKAAGNFNATFVERQIREAISLIENAREEIEAFAHRRAAELLAEHTKVKEFTSDGSVSVVEPCLPVDVMAAFVLLPADEE